MITPTTSNDSDVSDNSDYSNHSDILGDSIPKKYFKKTPY